MASSPAQEDQPNNRLASDDDTTDIEEQMRREFPGWTIIRTGECWWAARGSLVREYLSDKALHATTPAELYLMLRDAS